MQKLLNLARRNEERDKQRGLEDSQDLGREKESLEGKQEGVPGAEGEGREGKEEGKKQKVKKLAPRKRMQRIGK